MQQYLMEEQECKKIIQISKSNTSTQLIFKTQLCKQSFLLKVKGVQKIKKKNKLRGFFGFLWSLI